MPVRQPYYNTALATSTSPTITVNTSTIYFFSCKKKVNFQNKCRLSIINGLVCYRLDVTLLQQTRHGIQESNAISKSTTSSNRSNNGTNEHPRTSSSSIGYGLPKKNPHKGYKSCVSMC